jgi:hypothetical protein
MTRTLTQVMLLIQKNLGLSKWARFGAFAVITMAYPTLLPLASANCRSTTASAQSRPVPTMPGAALAAQVAVSQNSQPKSSGSIVGLWNVNFLSGGAVVDVAFDAWHSDGTEILNDYTDPIEGNVCLGVWRQTNSNTYKLKHPSWYFDNNGNLLGTVVIHETVCLSRDGNSYAGTYAYDIYDVSGNFLEELTGQIQATRIKPD